MTWSGISYGACTTQEIHDLKAANYTTAEIDEICPICTPEDKISLAQADKTKAEIQALCSKRPAGGKPVEGGRVSAEENMEPYVLLFTKAVTFGFDAYHADKALKKKGDDGLERNESGEELFKVFVRYTLPVSSMVYAFDNNRPAKPHPLLKAFRLYAEGNYSNAIKSDDGGSGVNIKTESTLFYNVGVKFETDIESLFSRGKTYKYLSNY